jgi:hypothetical protein
MRTRVAIAAALSICAGLWGCAPAGVFPALNLTQVELSEGNYQIVATNVAGQAEAGYLVGLSFSNGMMTQTLALYRLQGTGMLYKEAIEDLWKNYEAQHGKPEGRKLALVNVRYDADPLNLLVYARARISIRADVVEFKDDED